MLLAASVLDLKQPGVLPLNAIELLDCVPEILIAWVSFFALFLIWQFVSLFLHSLYSFHNRKQQLIRDGWVNLYLRCSKGAGPFL